MNAPFDSLTPLSYDVIVADPPWDFDLWSENGNRKGAAPHYRLMSFDQIKALPVGHLARGDSLLFLWATGAMLPQQIKVMQAWGFAYKSELVWRKVTRNGKVRWGTGYRARSGHEPVLVGAIGNPPDRGFPSIFDGIAREHSRKPDEFYQMVMAKTLGARRCDLFSRETRSGFDCWGDEVGKFDRQNETLT